jgi:hypothetical protein
MLMNPATPTSVIAASDPPVITASEYPCLISLTASPIALDPEAHAVTAGIAGPWQLYLMAIIPAAILAIIFGTK